LLHDVLFGGTTNLAQIVGEGFVLDVTADPLEGGDCHGCEETDDHDDDHDLHEGEALRAQKAATRIVRGWRVHGEALTWV
jgi:hypothetical protein